jgi:RimJ/RimL family protein N-acetyltransferase
MVILAVTGAEDSELIVGVGQYSVDEGSHTAEAAFAIRESCQNQGIGQEMLSYLTYLARREGLLGFTAEVRIDNRPMLHVFEKGGFDLTKKSDAGVYDLRMAFR